MIPPHIRKHFLTDRGRGHLLGAGTFLGISIFAFNVSSQTFLINKYKNIVHLYKKGLPTPVSPDVLKLGEQVLDDMKFTTRMKSYIEFFSVCGFEVFYVGSIKSRHGAYVGVPGNFSYKSDKDVEKSLIMVDTRPVPWNSEAGQLFQDSLVLSDDAKKFAIARQLVFLSTYHFYFFAAINAMPVFMYTFLSHLANTKFYGLYKPQSFRLFVYSFVATFTFGVWSVAKDRLTKYYENDADFVASSLTPTYARGGIEFYAKTLEKNMALRQLMLSGESKFTLYGNESEFIRQRHVPFTIRKENVENVMQNFVQKSSNNLDAQTEYNA